MAVMEMEGVMSEASDEGDPPLDAKLRIDDTKYRRIMRRVGTGDGGTDTEVSAFNSSI
jgi:hypothetical protein